MITLAVNAKNSLDKLRVLAAHLKLDYVLPNKINEKFISNEDFKVKKKFYDLYAFHLT